MKCDDAIKKLSAYLDNELKDNLRTELENHLKICPDCSREHETLAGNAKFMLTLPEIEPSPYFIQQTLAKIRKTERREKGFFTWVPVPAMAVLILVLLSYFLSFSIKVFALEPESRKKIAGHAFESAVKGSHVLGHVSFKKFCKRSCDILCECKICPMYQNKGDKMIR
ncbi:MAG: zf-HC2 domain-containing protein [Elusimicrobia bacterium]|nr:zf-HC2 domain-containing protein [Elusimicrobiota bacterium]